jgi:hypothetical protein
VMVSSAGKSCVWRRLQQATAAFETNRFESAAPLWLNQALA